MQTTSGVSTERDLGGSLVLFRARGKSQNPIQTSTALLAWCWLSHDRTMALNSRGAITREGRNRREAIDPWMDAVLGGRCGVLKVIIAR